jgi:hypothetical protein
VTTQPTALAHQAFQPIPNLSTPMVNPDGTLATAWYRFLITLWQRTGCNRGAVQNAAVVNQAPLGAGAPLTVTDALTGKTIGTIFIIGQQGGPAVPQVLTASPFEFTADNLGTLTSFGGKLELSRDLGATWFPVGLLGGGLFLMNADQVRVSWFGATPPVVTWFPVS